jgi:predicted phosphoribosyltransferase
MHRFADRADAGRRLAPFVAQALEGMPRDAVVVLALPRGGVAVAVEVAAALGAPLDVLLVRKLGVPGHEELAFGAIASGGVRVLNAEIVAAAALGPGTVAEVIAAERTELARRERAYRGDRAPLDVAGRTVVVVDDGLATGATMRAALAALRHMGARRIVAAAPVGTQDACAALAVRADAVVCPLIPRRFSAVGAWYSTFDPVDDDAVTTLLAVAAADARCTPRNPTVRGA